MNEELKERIDRAKELLKAVQHVSIATVNADGSPHNSPVFMAFDDYLCAYWASDPLAQHSQNITRTHQVFLVLFEANKGGGLFIQASAWQLDETELEAGLAILNARRKQAVPIDHFGAASPQRLFKAEPQKFWINQAERDQAGFIIRDKRVEITLTDIVPA